MRLSGRQADGLAVIMAITVAVCLFSYWGNLAAPGTTGLNHGDRRAGAAVVKLSGDLREGGIYYLPENTNLSRFLEIAGINHSGVFDGLSPDHILTSGEAVVLDAHGRLRSERMNARERLALDLPIDLNRASAEELMLIVGIGPKTAVGIVEFRQEAGLFKNIDDLTKVPGIKEKRLKQWERYFYLPP